mmetsp:Transcript_25716/g.56397  ORF Transcript_25716/g.56397 Transcript_25716/m.56397 type:complete len:276 (-) Transcript_25716:215-1042(-)|eukprot:CAMPEP_0168163066 /NCGR_PEP_ID=MMETSP0139_2-20121125/168_1 /TAXON_ID=44445 /ORGANISM="Pseudo-nitzschia australis, Strain 10249 10 AB" /LENGTH=275 /DNA_ID=CAMNT_0008079917 /DNA_START=88 /DNA_END=915 /DNA_ORIENTATION=-
MYSNNPFRFFLLCCISLSKGVVAQEYDYPPGKTFKPGFCNVCRDAPNPSVAWRNLANPSQTFTMNGENWSCGYLQDTVQDVDPYNGGAGEARWCALAQTFANDYCTCSGPDIGNLNDQVNSINPACDLCRGQQLNYVPSVNSGITANTGVAGNMNCQGLYNAMAQGVLTSSLCGTVISNAGPTCCSIESIDIKQIGGNTGGNTGGNQQVPAPQNTPKCVSAAQTCNTNSDCCPGLECKIKIWDGPKYCSSSQSRPRTSIAGAGIGGAAGRSRSGH